MAYITYKFSRDKNSYEKTWDYSPRITWWISFITNWFWFTDITELTSNKRTCHKGLNMYFMLYSLAYIACILVQNFENLTYLNYFKWANWLPCIILPIMIISPCFKLMFKFSIFILFATLVLKILVSSANYELYSILVFILFNSIGIVYNYKYLTKVKGYKGFKLVKIEENKYSCYYLYNKLLKKEIKEIG